VNFIKFTVALKEV